MIRGILALVATGTGLLHAAVGDWQAWTDVRSPAMAAFSDNAVWTASGGGATRYDLGTGKARVYTNLDGLGSTDLVGILSLGDTLWASAATGDLCRLQPGSQTWERLGSYRQNGWTFKPRVLAASPDHSTLIVGGAQGLSFFSTTQAIALDNIRSFGNLADQKVHSVAVTSRSQPKGSDTVWVGLQDGAAYVAISDWASVGRGNGILSDPSKWTVFRRMSQPVVGLFRGFQGDSMRTAPDSGSRTRYDTAKTKIRDTTYRFDSTYVHDSLSASDSSLRITRTIDSIRILDTALLPLKIDTVKAPGLLNTGWTWAANLGSALVVATDWDLYWNGSRNIGSGSNHAIPIPGGLAVCTQGNGLLVLRDDGSMSFPPAPPQLPASPPHHVRLHPDGILDAWISGSVHRLPADRSGWSPGLLTPGTDKTSGMPSQALGLDPSGNLLLGTWGTGLWRRLETGGWDQFTGANSCVLPAIRGKPAVVASAISPANANGNWIGFHVQWTDPEGNLDSSSNLQVAFLPTAGSLRCLGLKERIEGAPEPIVLGFSQEGDSALWIAHATALLRYRILGESLVLANTVSIGNASSILWLGKRLYLLDNGILKVLDRSGKTWKASIPSAAFLQGRGYRKLDSDSLGNLWIGGAGGLDIVAVPDSTAWTLVQRLDHATGGLLTDDVTDFSLDRGTGTVALATPLGLNILQTGNRIKPDRLLKEQVRPYPNPFRKRRHAKVVFPGVNATAELRVYAADGSLVCRQGSADIVGDQFQWKPDASTRPGIYFWTVSDASTRLLGRLVLGD